MQAFLMIVFIGIILFSVNSFVETNLQSIVKKEKEKEEFFYLN